MSLANGAVSLSAVTSTTATVVVGNATNSPSSAPYSYQWYVSTTSGFTPGPGNIISGATTQTYTATGLIPGTQYYFVNKVTDSASPAATANSSQLGALTQQPILSQNQFAQVPILGMIDMPFDFNTHPAVLDASLANATIPFAYPGQVVKLVAYNNNYSANAVGSNSGPLHVVPCVSDSDLAVGVLNYNIKNQNFVAGQAAEISVSGNVIWMYATSAITQGAVCYLDITTNGGVNASGSVEVGVAYDGAAAAGALIRVYLKSLVF